MAGRELSNISVNMEVELDTPGFLKRSNSAPMINNLNGSNSNGNINSSQFAGNRTSQGCGNSFFSVESRVRRFSASYTLRPNGLCTSKLLARVDQIRQEECTDMLDREVAHENKLHINMRMSQSWEDLRIMMENDKDGDDGMRSKSRCNNSSTCDSSHNLAYSCSSPSPTRSYSATFPRQYYSGAALRTNLSPSPTRSYTTRSSLSPVTVRPSSFGSVKRKFDLVDNEPPTKRGSSGGSLLYAPARSESSTSPLRSSISSIGTPESFSSADSPGGFSLSAPGSPLDQPMRDVSKIDTNVL